MKENKSYKIIIPYTESASIGKKFTVEYVLEAENRFCAQQKANEKFDSYTGNTNACWIRTADISGIRIWRVLPGDPAQPDFIDELIAKLPAKSDEENIKLMKRLGDLEDITASSKIISLTKQTNKPHIVAVAIETLGKIADPTSFFAVKNAYRKDLDTEIKLAIVKALHKVALPEDDIQSFYKQAIKDPDVRNAVFSLEYSDLMPIWLTECNTDDELELIKEASKALGEKALIAITSLGLTVDDSRCKNAAAIIDALEPYAMEFHWADWPVASNIRQAYKSKYQSW